MSPRIPLLIAFSLAACGGSGDATTTVTTDAGVIATAAPTLKAGVDPAIFLPTVIAGYHPTAEELATSGKPCATDADCKTSAGQVVFTCSTPYYGQSQCHGAFPPGDQVQPGVVPSCAYYDCPADFECETEAESRSVACIEHQGKGGRDDGGGGGGGGGRYE